PGGRGTRLVVLPGPARRGGRDRGGLRRCGRPARRRRARAARRPGRATGGRGSARGGPVTGPGGGGRPCRVAGRRGGPSAAPRGRRRRTGAVGRPCLSA